jgi:hypothetical protein
MSRNHNRRVVCPLSAIFCCAAILGTYSSAPAATISLQGTMNTTAGLSDHVTVHVPRGVPSLVIRFPILQDDTLADPMASGNLQVVSKEQFVSSLTPTSIKSIQDSEGNSYRELTFTNPPAGDVKVQANIGHVELEADLDTPLPNNPVPLDQSLLTSDVAKFLKPSEYVQSDDPQIRDLAASIVGSAASESDAASRIGYWIRSNMRYGGYAELQGTDALSALKSRSSICCGWAHLFIALARASGIPARFVGGYVIAGSITYPMSKSGDDKMTMFTSSLMHAWVEVWYPNLGWIAYDPQASAGFVDTHHIRLWTSVDGGGGLPLVTWESYGGHARDVSFTESETAENVNDDVRVRYCGGSDSDVSGSVMFRR